MYKKFSGIVSTAVSALGTIWLFAETVQQKKTVVVVIYSLTAIIAVTASIKIFRRRRDFFSVAVDRFLSGKNEVASYSVGFVSGESDLRKVAKLDQKEYGEDSVQFSGLRSWWKRYKKGVFLLRKGTEVVGAFGIWPVKKTVYQDLVAGKRHEHELSAKSICGREDQPPYAYWYIGDIIYDRDLQLSRKDAPIHILLEGVLRRWLDSEDVAPEVSLCALAVRSPGKALGDGERLLLSFGFERAAQVPSMQDSTITIPVYVREASRGQLEAIYEDVKQRLDRLTEHSQRVHSVAPVSIGIARA